MQSTLIIAGVAFGGAAIVGGGLVAFKVEIPLVDSLPRQILLGVFGAVLLIAGFVTDRGGEENNEPIASDTTVDSPAVTSTALGAPTTKVEPSTTVTRAPTTVPGEPELEWMLIIDGGGRLGVTVPGDWSVEVTEDTIWASPEIEEWMSATIGEGPANHDGYYLHRVMQPVTGSFEEIAEMYLDEMPVPTQCAFAYGDVERPGSGYFTYRVYECTPGGSFVNEVEIGITPPWVTFESSRYLDDATREDIFTLIWQSFRSY
ncbi:MAG: hypothetical protein P1T08_05420 [Acidimicrobiia bacterium]|nr:hypothetical protein [Acidimicrobiia bacterium]